MKKLKITIITVCYNSASTIKDTFESVLNQDYDNYEYLVIDGKSKDTTLEIIKEYEKKFNGRMRYISEKDKGLYDAMNKGIKMASGDIIGLINSDDILASNHVFSSINKSFNMHNCDGVYSNLIFKDQNLNNIVRKFHSKKGNYKLGWFPPHPTLYLKKEVYKRYGNYDINYRIAADYDFMVRIMKKNIKLQYVDDIFVIMRVGGVSTDGLKGYYKSFKESYKVLKSNRIKFPLLINIGRTLKVFKQIIFKR